VVALRFYSSPGLSMFHTKYLGEPSIKCQFLQLSSPMASIFSRRISDDSQSQKDLTATLYFILATFWAVRRTSSNLEVTIEKLGTGSQYRPETEISLTREESADTSAHQ